MTVLLMCLGLLLLVGVELAERHFTGRPKPPPLPRPDYAALRRDAARYGPMTQALVELMDELDTRPAPVPPPAAGRLADAAWLVGGPAATWGKALGGGVDDGHPEVVVDATAFRADGHPLDEAEWEWCQRVMECHGLRTLTRYPAADTRTATAFRDDRGGLWVRRLPD